MQSNYSSGREDARYPWTGHFALVCSRPDTRFHSNKHEIDSKDQIKSACNWMCATVEQVVQMRSSVCV